MLSFEEKKAIFDSYPELSVNQVSMSRLNYHFEDSAVEKTVVVKFLHPNGNAFIYAGYLPKNETQKGYISIRDASESEIRDLLEEGIAFLKKTIDGYEEGYTENWVESHGDRLMLRYENGMWGIFVSDDSLEAIFGTRDAAVSYLVDEGFSIEK